MAVADPQIITVQPYMGSGQPEQQVNASGGSVVNTGDVNVYLTSVPGDYGVDARCFTLVPGASLPWPDKACYCFTDQTAGLAGEIYVSPVQTSNFPQAQTVNVTVDSPVPTAIVRKNGVGGVQQLLPAPATSYNLFGIETDNASGSSYTELVIDGESWIVPSNDEAGDPYPLWGYKTLNAVNVLSQGGTVDVALAYSGS